MRRAHGRSTGGPARLLEPHPSPVRAPTSLPPAPSLPPASGHNYCRACLRRNLELNRPCPKCRARMPQGKHPMHRGGCVWHGPRPPTHTAPCLAATSPQGSAGGLHALSAPAHCWTHTPPVPAPPPAAPSAPLWCPATPHPLAPPPTHAPTHQHTTCAPPSPAGFELTINTTLWNLVQHLFPKEADKPLTPPPPPPACPAVRERSSAALAASLHGSTGAAPFRPPRCVPCQAPWGVGLAWLGTSLLDWP